MGKEKTFTSVDKNSRGGGWVGGGVQGKQAGFATGKS